MTDEDTFVVPESWRERILPRRGDGLPVELPDLATARRTGDELLDALGHELGPVLRTSKRNHAAAIRDALADPDRADPGGAARLAELARNRQETHGQRLVPLVDGWVARHGVTFAARALLRLAELPSSMGSPDHARRNVALLQRGRRWLAAASDAEYAAAVTMLPEFGHVAVIGAFLLLTETAWVDAACQVAGWSPLGWELCWYAAHTVPQAERLIFDGGVRHHVPVEALLTAAAATGAGIAAPLGAALDGHVSAAQRRAIRSVLAAMPTDAAFRALLREPGRELQEASDRFPVRAARLLAEDGPDDLMRIHVVGHREAARVALSACAAPAAQRIESLLATAAGAPAAPPEAVPPLLANPPWRVKRPAPPRLRLTAPRAPVELRWLPGERDDWLLRPVTAASTASVAAMTKRVIAAGSLDAVEHSWDLQRLLGHGDVATLRPLLAGWQPADDWYEMRWLVARYGIDAYPAVLHAAREDGYFTTTALLPFEADELPELMARRYSRAKSVRQVALDWLVRHPVRAADQLVPLAVGKAAAARRDAGQALRALAEYGCGDVVRAAAEKHGADAARAIDAVLADRLGVTGKIPTLPDWLDPVVLPQVLLTDRRALPEEAVRTLCVMLAWRPLDQPYPAIAVVRPDCDPASLAAFGWALLELWLANGAPAKDKWALAAVGSLGDDATAHRLAATIQDWAVRGKASRAVTGLETLAAMGTDTALRLLLNLGRATGTPSFTQHVREQVDEVAARRGLTADQLADRLLPDLGLAADRTLRLDYGPRRFVVGVDDHLKPYVTDEDGAPRRTLPKPTATDDEARASAAYQRFDTLWQQVKALAPDAIGRLERAMALGRRWTLDEFRAGPVAHPVLRTLAARLVWAHHDGNRAVGSFRIAEDGTFAGVDDEEYPVPDDALVGVAHPLELADTLAGWAGIFADYRILQPFPQLDRTVHTMTEKELDTDHLARFENRTTRAGAVLSLAAAWRAPQWLEGGHMYWLVRELRDDWTLEVMVVPGIYHGDPAEQPEQHIDVVWLRRSGMPAGSFRVLGPVLCSEILRDLERLVNR